MSGSGTSGKKTVLTSGVVLSATHVRREERRGALLGWAGPRRRRKEGERAARERIEEQARLGQKKDEEDRESCFFSIFLFVFLICKPISNINQIEFEYGLKYTFQFKQNEQFG